mmetsp:Transcript_39971/g.94877  ORF Transcript_39971/g.94877 Transcript_39971/m.94877 type:complete len:466 (-) Transcript_39971:63-1460(-)
MTKQRRCCTAGLLICVVMLMAMMCSAEQSSVEADASQTGHWNAEGSVRFHDIPEEHALDSSLPRGRQRVGEVCRVVMLEPLDRRIISFHLHHNITIVFQILCEADNQTSSSPPPASSELTGSILLDGHTFANFSIPAPLPSAAPQNFSLPLEVHQWFETNIVLRCHQAQPASLQAKCVGLTRTASLHEKHYFTVAIWRSSDPELNTWNTTGAIAELPFYLEAMDLVQSGLTLLSPRHAQKVPEGEQIDVIASLSAPYPPSVISVNLFFGKNKAVSVWPDWKLPALGSSDLPLLHVTVAFRPKVGKYPLRLEVVCARQGAVASLTSFFEIVPAHLTHAPPPKPPNWYPKDEEDEEEEEEDESSISMTEVMAEWDTRQCAARMAENQRRKEEKQRLIEAARTDELARIELPDFVNDAELTERLKGDGDGVEGEIRAPGSQAPPVFVFQCPPKLVRTWASEVERKKQV